MADLSQITLNPASGAPLYKQLAEAIRARVDSGTLRSGERLPATRELAGQLGLNRTTVTAAYASLEHSGLLQGHVGRGSFVAGPAPGSKLEANWEAILPPLDAPPVAGYPIEINFATSRPAAEAFPLEQFRRQSKEVIDSAEAGQILQLGSSHGYAPLRRYLLEAATANGVARTTDDLIVTNGCQQALDLIARLFISDAPSDNKTVVLEDPVYHGVLRVFGRAGANLISVPVDQDGLHMGVLEDAIAQAQPRLLVVTPNFQNPTGATLSLARRKRLVELAQRWGVVLVENDIYGELRYVGRDLPTLKQLDESGNTILLRSYSKVSFPGLRVGWVIAPRPVIARLAEAKQISDLHSDQLSQAVLLRFAESGELARHLVRTQTAGAERLRVVLDACAKYLPAGSTFTRPEGGMSLWVELPAGLSADSVLAKAEERGVSFLPGHFFANRKGHRRGLRISFGGLAPREIIRGIQLLGEAAGIELRAHVVGTQSEPVAALV